MIYSSKCVCFFVFIVCITYSAINSQNSIGSTNLFGDWPDFFEVHLCRSSQRHFYANVQMYLHFPWLSMKVVFLFCHLQVPFASVKTSFWFLVPINILYEWYCVGLNFLYRYIFQKKKIYSWLVQTSTKKKPSISDYPLIIGCFHHVRVAYLGGY